jgi:hypothetical protein
VTLDDVASTSYNKCYFVIVSAVSIFSIPLFELFVQVGQIAVTCLFHGNSHICSF